MKTDLTGSLTSHSFHVIPAIDLKEGRCVMLTQGKRDEESVYGNDPARIAKEFEAAGAKRLHVVDLDGAFDGGPRNASLLLDIVRAVDVPVQTGGGIRDMATIDRLLSEGVDRVIIGTTALRSPEIVREACEKYGPKRVLVGIDARDGKVAVEGWVEESDKTAVQFALEMKALGVDEIVYTDISRDGMLQGPNFAGLEHMVETGIKVVASGGVSSVEDLERIARLSERGVTGAIVGKAIYTGDIDLDVAIRTVDIVAPGEIR